MAVEKQKVAVKSSKITKVKKRDGRVLDFDSSKIAGAIWKAASSIGGADKKLSEKLASLSLTNQGARNLTRILVQSAVELNLDGQGRTLIPEHLREQVNIKKQVVVAGTLTRIEIWDRDAYHEHLDLIAQTINQADQGLAGIEL